MDFNKIAMMTEEELDALEGFISRVRNALTASKAAHNQVDKAPDAASCESSFTCPKCGHVHDYKGDDWFSERVYDQLDGSEEVLEWECDGCDQEMIVDVDWNPRFAVRGVEG